MKATTKKMRGIMTVIAAVLLLSVMLTCVACTRDDHLPHDPKDTAGTVAGTGAGTAGGTNQGKPSVTAPADGNGTGAGSLKPLDPDAGTVMPDKTPGDPPAGTGKAARHHARLMPDMH